MSAPTSPPKPRVGVAVFVLHPSNDPTTNSSPRPYKFILGKRLGSHGANTYALPGGHLEYSETFEECAAREVLEETGLVVENVKFLTATNDFMPVELDVASGEKSRGGQDGRGSGGQSWGKHYVTIFMTARVKSVEAARNQQTIIPEAKVLEPDKCAGWNWVTWDELVNWASPQITALGKQGGWSMKETQEAAEKRGGEDEVGPTGTRTLFSPLISLLVQRPDAIPSLDMSR